MSEITKGSILQSNAENEREEIELKEKYKQIFILKRALKKANIPFEFFEKEAFGYHLCYPNRENCVCSVIENICSYGNDWDLLEIMGLLTDEEQEFDAVAGYLSACDVFNKIRADWLKNRDMLQERENPKPLTNYERIKNMSVDEMAGEITSKIDDCPDCICYSQCDGYENNNTCISKIKQWLESEVEE